MTRDEIIDVLSVVAIKWPHSNLGAREEAVAGWLDELAQFDRTDAEAAVRRLSASGREHAPTAGIVAQAVRVASQGPPPSFDDAQAWVSRRISAVPYGTRDTVAAIEALAEAGAHEAVLRMVQTFGVYAVRMMPDPTWQPLDMGRQADRRDMARDYQQRVLADWRSDPTPGLALSRARGVALNGGQRPGLRRTNAAALLPQPEPEGDRA